MNLSQVLSVVGALAGSTGAIFGITAFLRDRARLVVIHQLATSDVDDARVNFVRITIVNAGRQPVTVIGAGLMERYALERWRRKALHSRVLDTIARRRPGSAFAWPALDEIDEEPLVLTPGEFKKYTLVDAAVHPSGDQAFLAYAYAMTFGGKISFARYPVEVVSGHWRPTTWEPYYY
jgi:hypothetical protein